MVVPKGGPGPILALTGTPGTGKTAIAAKLERAGWGVVDLKKLVEEEGLADEGDIVEVDPGQLSIIAARSLKEISAPRVIIEGHLAHELGLADHIVVLRCHPDELDRRLTRRGYDRVKVEENCEAEALDIIVAEAMKLASCPRQCEALAKAIERADDAGLTRIMELDTTDREPEEAARAIEAWVDDPTTPNPYSRPPGTARWLPDYLGLD